MTTPQTIVVGYDRSAASRHAFRVAAEMAARLHAHMHVVHVIDLDDYPVDPDRPDWEQRGQVALTKEFDEVRLDLAEWSGEWTYHLERGEPARAILSLAEAENALLIIVGSSGDGVGSTLQHLLTGTRSVSHDLLRRKTRPVLVVPLPIEHDTKEAR